MRVLSCSITEAGAELARRLPYEHRSNALVATVRDAWDSYDGFVLICATGIAVRAIAPLLSDKDGDPAVVCLDDAGRHAVALVGGHAAGSNALASEVASLTGATAVVTTATDLFGVPALDRLPGFRASGDIAGVTRRWLDGSPPAVEVDTALEGWPLPFALVGGRSLAPSAGAGGDGPTRVFLTDKAAETAADVVVLRPPSLVAGVGTSRGASSLSWFLSSVLDSAGLHQDSVSAVATIDLKLSEPAVVALGLPIVTFPAITLAGLPVPNPSSVVDDAVGTPSVAEAAALLAAGPGSTLVVPKTISDRGDATIAVARRRRPAGHLSVVGLGPGPRAQQTAESVAAVRDAEVVIGYGPYVDQAAPLLSPAQRVLRYPIGAECERSNEALRLAAGGARVALLCSGDPGVYALSSLVCELAPSFGSPPVTIIPGVTAALAAAAVLGGALGHDHAAVSLSDLLTDWAVIVRRLEAAAIGDFVVSLYNPRSKRRTSQLDEALSILRRSRPSDTPVAVVTDVGRPGSSVVRTDLSSVDTSAVGMTSLVVIGSSQTRWVGSFMVTPRGYRT